MQPSKDRFTRVAGAYARYRPGYPEELYAFVLSQVSERKIAWDAGTGSGQVAGVLASHFDSVFATDISSAQLANAALHPKITYRTCRAERSGLENATIDLVTVAQAVHWFDLSAFATEVQRVAKPGCMLAIWGYGLFVSDPEIDRAVRTLYVDILQDYWDARRAQVDRHYRDLEFPFDEIPCPSFELQHHRTAEDILGYLRTWSAVDKYHQDQGKNPVALIEPQIRHVLGDGIITCRTPVFLRLWRVDG